MSSRTVNPRAKAAKARARDQKNTRDNARTSSSSGVSASSSSAQEDRLDAIKADLQGAEEHGALELDSGVENLGVEESGLEAKVDKELPSWVHKKFPELKKDDYLITGIVGSGGQGLVLRLEDSTGEEYTGKIYLTHEDRIIRNVKRGIELSGYFDDKQLQSTKEVIELDDTSFMVVKDYIPGKTLREILKEKGSLTDEEILPLSVGLFNALNKLHERKYEGQSICHRDIRPENIVIREDGTVTLIDLDLLRAGIEFGVNLPTEMTSVGAKRYQSPSSMIGFYGETDDRYSVGVILAEAKLGHIPKELDLSKMPGYTAFKLKGIKRTPLVELIENLVNQNEDERFTSDEEVLEFLSTNYDLKNRKNSLDDVVVSDSQEMMPPVHLDTNRSNKVASDLEILKRSQKIFGLENEIGNLSFELQAVEYLRWYIYGGVATGIATTLLRDLTNLQIPHDYLIPSMLVAGTISSLLKWNSNRKKRKELERELKLEERIVELPDEMRLGKEFNIIAYKSYLLNTLESFDKNNGQIQIKFEGSNPILKIRTKRGILNDEYILINPSYDSLQFTHTIENKLTDEKNYVPKTNESVTRNDLLDRKVISGGNPYEVRKDMDKDIAKALDILEKKRPDIYATFVAMLPETYQDNQESHETLEASVSDSKRRTLLDVFGEETIEKLAEALAEDRLQTTDENGRHFVPLDSQTEGLERELQKEKYDPSELNLGLRTEEDLRLVKRRFDFCGVVGVLAGAIIAINTTNDPLIAYGTGVAGALIGSATGIYSLRKKYQKLDDEKALEERIAELPDEMKIGESFDREPYDSYLLSTLEDNKNDIVQIREDNNYNKQLWVKYINIMFGKDVYLIITPNKDGIEFQTAVVDKENNCRFSPLSGYFQIRDDLLNQRAVYSVPRPMTRDISKFPVTEGMKVLKKKRPDIYATLVAMLPETYQANSSESSVQAIEETSSLEDSVSNSERRRLEREAIREGRRGFYRTDENGRHFVPLDSQTEGLERQGYEPHTSVAYEPKTLMEKITYHLVNFWLL